MICSCWTIFISFLGVFSRSSRLPSMEFQPEIIASNDQSIGQLKCEIYTGEICRPYLGSNYVSNSHLDIEVTLLDNLRQLSKKCQDFLLPIICLFVYPMCDEQQTDIRSICRQSCFYFQNHSCMREFSFLQNLPTCDNLPPSSDDHRSCLKINPFRTSEETNIENPSIFEQFFTPFNSFPMVALSIILPIIFICLLISILCCCYYCRNGKRAKNLSATKRPSSHLFLSPFQSNIQQTMATSSISSTNTNLTNSNHRSMILTDIPFANLRFLQEIGEGNERRSKGVDREIFDLTFR